MATSDFRPEVEIRHAQCIRPLLLEQFVHYGHGYGGQIPLSTERISSTQKHFAALINSVLYFNWCVFCTTVFIYLVRATSTVMMYFIVSVYACLSLYVGFSCETNCQSLIMFSCKAINSVQLGYIVLAVLLTTERN